MLKMGSYPQYLKERISSNTGHMSNLATAEFLAENFTEHLHYIWLCHLSKDNNHPELAKNAHRFAIERFSLNMMQKKYEELYRNRQKK